MDPHLAVLPRIEASGQGRLRSVAGGLWATPPETLSGPVNTCGFLIQRAEGNVFVYSYSAIEAYYDHIDELGGVAMVLLNHRDEAGSHVTALADRYNATVHAHATEVEPCLQRGVAAINPLAGDTELGSDLEAWHTPGHTPGVMSYCWHNPNDDLRYLFTGDTFNQTTFDRVTAIFTFYPYEGNTQDLRQTLMRVREGHSDVLVPGLDWGDVDAYRWSAEERHRLFDHLITQLDATTHQ